jgi:hypothetical protein
MNKKADIEHYQSFAAVIRWISLADICFIKEKYILSGRYVITREEN